MNGQRAAKKPNLGIAFSSSLLLVFALSNRRKRGEFIVNKCGFKRIQGNREAYPSLTIIMENQVKRRMAPGSRPGENSPSPLFCYAFFLFFVFGLFFINCGEPKRHAIKKLKRHSCFFFLSFLFFSFSHYFSLFLFVIVFFNKTN